MMKKIGIFLLDLKKEAALLCGKNKEKAFF